MTVTVSPTENAAVWGPAVVAVAILLSNLLAWALNPRSWAHRHLLSRVGVPQMLFVSNRREGVPKAAKPQSYWCFDLLDPHHLVESPLLNTSGLLVLHAAIFLYWVAAVLVDVVVEYYGYGCTASWCWRRSGPYLEWMTFLTNWSLSILGISGLVAFLNTARYARRQRSARKQQQQHQQQQGQQPGELELGAAPVQSLHQHTSSTNTASPVPAAAAATPAAAGAGGWVHVFHRGGAATTDALSGPATIRDQAAAAHQQQKQREGGGSAVQQQQQQQQSSSADGSSCCSSSSSSGSGSCDTVVVMGPDAAGPSSRVHTEKWDWLSVTHCLLSEVATTAAFFVSFWFWVGLVAIAGEFFRANGGTLMAHAGNLVLALCVVLLTRLPLVSTHFQVLLWYACLYMIFLLAYGGGSGTWRYGLDVQKAKPAAALLLVPLIVFIFFCLWFLVARLREAFLSRLRRRQHAGRRAKQAQLQQQHTADTTAAAAAV